jgi:hypothetical protein
VGDDQQPEQGELAEEMVGPIGADADHPAEPPDRPGDAGGLRVDQPGGHGLERPVTGLLGRRETLLDLVGQPAVELDQARLDPVGALLDPARRRGRIG